MRAQHLALRALLVVLLTWQSEAQDDDDVKGPLMSLKPDGSLLTTEEVIKQYKHKGESHSVLTEDGYQLKLFRVVPEKLPVSVVLLQHGFLFSSDCWVTDSDSLVFKLSDAGFDVWISNSRGNAYSRSHTKLKPEDKEFWNFSFHEMGSKDLPAVIDYILKKTGQSSLHYVGHSMGTTMSYVLLSTRPEYNSKVKTLVGLAPVAFLSKLADMLGPDGMAEEIAVKYMKQFKESGKMEAFPRKDIQTNNKTQITCDDIEENFRDMCSEKMEEAYKVLGGPYLPAGQSFKTMEHFYQSGANGVITYYKFPSAEENKKAYGREEPHTYVENFKEVKVPTLLWSTDFDQIVMEKDVDDLKAALPNVVADNRIKDVECFDHVAFLFPQKKSCIPLREKVCNEVVEAIKKFDKK